MKMFTKKPHPCGVRSFSTGEEFTPIWVFPVEDFFLFGGQVIGIIPEQIVYLAFIESEQVLTDIIAIVNPKDDIRFAVLAETHAPPFYCRRTGIQTHHPKLYMAGCPYPIPGHCRQYKHAMSSNPGNTGNG